MSSINVLNVIVLNSITRFRDQLQFEIVFECLSELKNGTPYILYNFLDIEWKVIYIGSAEDDTYDQVLDSVLIGPLQAAAPNYTKIPEKDLIGVTAILLTCSYNNQEFFRVGYYVNNVYDNEEMTINPPETIQVEHIVRSILADKPRITKFNINWDSDVNVIPSYNNHNYMFGDANMSSENIQNSFSNNVNNNNNNINPFAGGMDSN